MKLLNYRTDYFTDGGSSTSLRAIDQLCRHSQQTILVQEQATRLIKKIDGGIKRIRKILKKEKRLPLYFSGDPPTDPDQACTSLAACSSGGSYNAVLESLLTEADRCTQRGDEWRFRAWCCRFNAGTLDYIADLIPTLRIDSQAVAEEKSPPRTTRKRWRDGARLLHYIVHNLPDEPEIVYAAVASKCLLRFSDSVLLIDSSKKLPILNPGHIF